MTAGQAGRGSSTWIQGKDERLEVLSEDPYVVSTPIEVLAGQRITDKRSLFIRNIQDRAEAHTLEPQSMQGWEIELVGLIDPVRVVIQAEDLLDMEQVEFEMVLQCSGNGRFMYVDIPGYTLEPRRCGQRRLSWRTPLGGPGKPWRHDRPPGAVRDSRGRRGTHGT